MHVWFRFLDHLELILEAKIRQMELKVIICLGDKIIVVDKIDFEIDKIDYHESKNF